MDNIGRHQTITSADAGTKKIIAGSHGVFNRIIINTSSAQALTIYDDKTITNPTGSMAVIKASIVEQSLEFNAAMRIGIVVDVPGGYTGNATFVFKYA